MILELSIDEAFSVRLAFETFFRMTEDIISHESLKNQDFSFIVRQNVSVLNCVNSRLMECLRNCFDSECVSDGCCEPECESVSGSHESARTADTDC
uniref:Uncharacterized protein n=1 Tax=Dulem virus 80 TaxID=3145791 RepID=A0AAU8AX61_9VIRU